MTDRELDALIAEKVMGWAQGKETKSAWFDADGKFQYWINGERAAGWMVRGDWIPSTDRNAAALVLERVKELGITEEFVLRLHLLNNPDCPNFSHSTFKRSSLFSLITATPRQLMEAALATVGMVPA